MKMSRDMSRQQFNEALTRHGFDPSLPFGGYCQVVEGPAKGLCISKLNAGPRRRAQLAYLIQEKKKW